MMASGVPSGASTPYQVETSKPGRVSATVGISGACGERFRLGTPSARNWPFLMLPRVDGMALNDLLAGQGQMMFNAMPSTLGNIKNGQLRALGVTSLKRSPQAPEIPTVAETLPGFEVSTWYGVLAPLGTPDAIIQKLNYEIIKAAQAPDIRKKLEAQGVDLQLSTPQAFGALLKSETAKWAEVIRVTGVKAE